MQHMTILQREAARETDSSDAADEAQLLQRARTDLAYFGPLYERYLPRIYRYCWRRLGHADEAEDVTSLIFTHALQGLKKYRGGSVAAWLFQIAHNTVISHFRHRRVRIVIDALPTDLIQPGEPALDNLIRAEESQRIRGLIAALPDDQQELLALKIDGNLSAREIGAVVGKSEGAVRVAIFRIMEQLRKDYQQAENSWGNDHE